MLSLDKAAAGANLMEATHVVLLDPMTGTKKEAQAYESQAIGEFVCTCVYVRVCVCARVSTERCMHVRMCAC